MSRWLSIAVSVLFLLLCAATLMIWARSYAARDDWWWHSPARLRSCAWSRGEILVSVADFKPTSNMRIVQFRGHHSDVSADLTYAFRSSTPGSKAMLPLGGGYAWGFGATRHVWAGGQSRDVILPLWAPALVFGGLGSIIFYMRPRHAGRIGLCKKCGYDLRASSGRCPECGTPIPSKAGATA